MIHARGPVMKQSTHSRSVDHMVGALCYRGNTQQVELLLSFFFIVLVMNLISRSSSAFIIMMIN